MLTLFITCDTVITNYICRIECDSMVCVAGFLLKKIFRGQKTIAHYFKIIGCCFYCSFFWVFFESFRESKSRLGRKPLLPPQSRKPGFLPGNFSGGKIYCYANFFCYANFSIVFGPNFAGQKSLRGDKLPRWGGAPCPLVKESQTPA